MIKYYCIVLFLVGLTHSSLAQKLTYRQGQIIVKLKQDSNLESVLQKIDSPKKRDASAIEGQLLVPNLGIYLIYFDFTEVNENFILQQISELREVRYAQFNRLLELRAEPNDPLFDEQWHYINLLADPSNANADFDAELAWEIGTGGLTANGDTIVVAVLDNGIDIQHEDLKSNLWINHAEIPNNGIDDDNNSYVDDYAGFNSTDSSGSTPKGNHGTSVAGIIGAVGNNNIGVTGINWNIKIMNIYYSSGDRDEAKILRAYGYAYNQRRIYNESNCTRGAFVVATNASWGIKNTFSNEFPIWCEFYDDLGKEGILNCGATVNENFDVDVVGDMPTTCGSEYFLGITNIDRNNEKPNRAGFGNRSIDLAAYGTDILTTSLNNNYTQFRGTSAATPAVVGAIGLLYSSPCPSLVNLAKNNPSEASLLVKQHILDGVKPIEALEQKTVTEGVLNVYNSMVLSQKDCDTFIDNDSDNFIVAPNPIIDYCKIRGFELCDRTASISIHASNGQMIINQFDVDIFSCELELKDFYKLPAGVYLINVATSNKNELLRVVKL